MLEMSGKGKGKSDFGMTFEVLEEAKDAPRERKAVQGGYYFKYGSLCVRGYIPIPERMMEAITAAQPVYHSEPLYVPHTQHEPQVQHRAVVDRHGQHILPEDSSGTWARFSEQNAAALEIL